MPLRSILLASLLALAAPGCDEAPEPEQPVIEPLPTVPALTPDDPGHLSVEQRGVALDTDDIAVLTDTEQPVGVTPARLASEFGLLVQNRPYVDWQATRCPRSSEAERVQPRQSTERILADLADEGVRFDRIAVNVALLTPGQRALQYVCFDESGAEPRFDVLEHRRALIDAFTDLAGLDGIAYITVGVEMNRYYHLTSEAGDRLVDDYSNFISLYREIYTAIKAANPDVKVGPGISWAVFQRLTMPELAADLGLDPTSLDAAVAAWRRTVRPLLTEGRGGERVRTADYLGVTMIPFDSEDPWRGEASSDNPDRQAELYDGFAWLPLLVSAGTADEIPLVMPIVDWAEQSGAAGAKKGPFLATLKAATSVLDVEWLAWRRLSTLPDEPPEANPCRKYTSNNDPALRYPTTYCNAGLLDESGSRRSVWDELLTAP